VEGLLLTRMNDRPTNSSGHLEPSTADVDAATRRLMAALDALERAVELDGSLVRTRKLERANREIAERLDTAISTIRAVLGDETVADVEDAKVEKAAKVERPVKAEKRVEAEKATALEKALEEDEEHEKEDEDSEEDDEDGEDEEDDEEDEDDDEEEQDEEEDDDEDEDE
jgi:hypothetical protein